MLCSRYLEPLAGVCVAAIAMIAIVVAAPEFGMKEEIWYAKATHKLRVYRFVPPTSKSWSTSKARPV